MTSLLERLDARDRALFERWVLEQSATWRVRLMWEVITHLGSGWCSIAVCLVPVFSSTFVAAGRFSLATLAASHLVIQVLKRRIGRARPSSDAGHAWIDAPDRFSFPSGHAAAAMSVALGFGHAFPDVAALLVMFAVLVGLSRVVLGVHYPSDVLAGQAAAAVTALALGLAGVG